MFGNLEVSKRKIIKEIEVLDNQGDNSELEASSKLKRMELVSLLKVINNKIVSLLC